MRGSLEMTMGRCPDVAIHAPIRASASPYSAAVSRQVIPPSQAAARMRLASAADGWPVTFAAPYATPSCTVPSVSRDIGLPDMTVMVRTSECDVQCGRNAHHKMPASVLQSRGLDDRH